MIEAIFEVIFSFVGELVLEIVAEVLLELGFHGTADRVSRGTKNRFLLGLAYALFGGVLGFASLYIFPKIEFANAVLPVLYFIASPLIAGFALTTVSWILDRGIGNSKWFQLDKFVFGVVFAMSYSLSRVLFG